ncbi:acetoacetate decarboxylase [Pseudovibrio sp. SPO723]|uniref:acetoacetate decarboxylase n=1 Tax=Nesiotobacter zosterae TaxID=392721 RepID=UPI0029C1AD81|nr:acetoacetate decarboxylase [Pseudovibrio sp. SPO723]MDX5595692.1 acetoacetate decarboxylase [Pseudovibrio sp. SPO723]
MNAEDILKQASMPIAAPAYPKGPYRFINREFLTIIYESDPDAIREALPEPLEPDGSNTVMFETIRMPDSAGFGNYTEAGLVIPAKFGDHLVNFTHQMFLDCSPPIYGGREIWGFPKKLGYPRLFVEGATLTGHLEFDGTTIAIGTMGYKYQHLLYDVEHGTKCHPDAILKKLQKTQVNLKIIPDVDGSLAIAQLVAYEVADITVKGAWSGPAGLQLFHHANAPLASLPVKKVVGGLHFITDLTLPYGRVLHDYLK